MSQYEVQRLIGDNWENWSMGDDEKTPARYPTEKAARKAMSDHIRNCKEAVADGFMEEAETEDDLRVVKV